MPEKLDTATRPRWERADLVREYLLLTAQGMTIEAIAVECQTTVEAIRKALDRTPSLPAWARATTRRVYLPETVAAKDWREDALCRDRSLLSFEEMDDLFFTDFLGERAQIAQEQAKAICAQCPVRDECLELALDLGLTGAKRAQGVWGGTTEEERREMLRQRRLTAMASGE